MIPYAILMVRFVWSSGRSLDVRALDPTEHGFTFRLAEKAKGKILQDRTGQNGTDPADPVEADRAEADPADRTGTERTDQAETDPTDGWGKGVWKESPDRVEFRFLDYEKQTYIPLALPASEWTVEDAEPETADPAADPVDSGDPSLPTAQDEESADESFCGQGFPGSRVLVFRSEDPEFRRLLQKLLRDYMRYIRLKLENDELSAMEQMTGHLLKETFPASLEEWQREQIVRAQGADPKRVDRPGADVSDRSLWKGEHLAPVEIAVSLDLPHLWKDFLEKDRETFLSQYWQENGLQGHPITKEKVTHLYIGSSFCPLLLPETETLRTVMDRAVQLGFSPVPVFGPMPEDRINAFERAIDVILTWAKEKQKAVEIVVNDPGTALLIREKRKERQAEEASLTVRSGPLLCRRKKDIRMGWHAQPDRTEKENFHTEQEIGIYRTYLKKECGISSFSCEVTGYPIAIPGENTALHLPLYQMNTSGTCTLYALCKNGDRGKQESISDCPHFCETHQVFYPGDLPMIGRWNSLFGCSMPELNDVRTLNDRIDRGVRRLVVRM